MTRYNDINKALAKVGLSENQADIYLLLLQRGSLRISELTRLLNMPRSSIYEHLRVLFELGLAEEIVENSFKRIRPYPISNLKHILDEKIQQLNTQGKELKSLDKSLASLPLIKPQQPTILRYYRGKAGARQLFWNTLKAKSTLYVYSEWGRGRYVGIDFYKSFVAESYEREIQEKVLVNPMSRVLESIRQHTGTSVSRTNIQNVRCISQDTISFKGDTLMYDNIYAQIYLKEAEISGFEIESKHFVDTQKAIYETLWSTAQPLSELL